MRSCRWSCRLAPTPGLSSTTGIPNFVSCSAGPMPDSIMRCGEPIAPAARMTSPWERRRAGSAALPPSPPDGPFAGKRETLNQTASFQPQIPSMQHRLEEAARRRPAAPALLVDVKVADALIVAGVEIVDCGNAVLDRSVAKRLEGFPV